jgi:hypothetical protein
VAGGGRGSRRWLGSRIGVIFAAGLLFVFFAVPTQAVNATGAFELDGNAVTSHTGTGAPDDWDRVCHDVTASFLVPLCTTAGSTNGASALSWASQGPDTGTTFTGGGSKDPINVSSWAWNQASGGLPGKDILLNGFAARYNLPANATNCPSLTSVCSVVFFGMDRFDNSGDAQNGFWFFQNAITLGTTKSGGGQTFIGLHKNGDVLVVSDFSIGGTISTITVYRWDTACLAAGNPDANCADSNLRTLATSTAANCAITPANAPFCGIVNAANGTTSPWPFTDKGGNTSFQQGEFYEGGINLSLFPGLAGECFASTLAESRSSTSTSAVLKSFVLGGFGSCTSKITTTASPAGSVSIGTGSVSTSDSAMLTVGGAATWSGTVAFSLCGPNAGTCATGGTAIGSPQTVNQGTNQPILSSTATVTSAGSYCWRADFTSSTTGVPNATDNGSNSAECFTVNPVTPTLGTTAGPTVLLGQAVTDTATLSGAANQPGSPVINGPLGPAAGGSITFTLFGPTSCTTPASGTGTNPQTVSVTGNGSYGPVSFTPNAVGTYHWVASYSGNLPNTLGTTHNTTCNDGGEDVIVQQLPTTTVTTPVDGSNATVSTASFGASVFDHAVVTGSAAGGSPTGTVSFFICDPNHTSGLPGFEVCADGTGTALIGNPVAVTAGPGANQSQATSSPAVVANQVGVWCFRATFTPTGTFYTGSSDATHDECFTITDTTSVGTAQNWLPNDSATITSGGSPLSGSVTFVLYPGNTCSGTALYTEASQAISGTSPQSAITHNTSVKVSASATVSWLVTYTPSSTTFISGNSHCEVTSLTITN